ncbi:hypothetical protein [Spirillospora albida]|nr:hypothetical protein [Spirillospora albida]
MIALVTTSIGAVALLTAASAASAAAFTVGRRPRYVGRHRTRF